MADVQPATVEINDAVFCTHFKELVRVTRLPCNIPHVDADRLTTTHPITRLNSALTATTMVGRRTTLSTGSISLLDESARACSHFALVISSTLLIGTLSRLPQWFSIKKAFISARNTGLRVSNSRYLRQRLAELRVIRMQSMLWLEETDHKGEGSCQKGGQKVVL